MATIPHIRSELKTWKVWARLIPSSIVACSTTQPPSPFYPLAESPPPNHLLLTASFGRILPYTLLSLFRPTHTLNVHPSALPAYRGPAPIQRSILNGERDTSVCVIEMKRRGGIDAGDVLGRVPVVRVAASFFLDRRADTQMFQTIPSGIAFGPLRDTLAQEGGELLVSVLRSVLNGTETRTPQSPLAPTTPHAPFITPADSQPDFAQETAEQIVRRHLALAHHKPLTTYLPCATRTVQIHDPAVFPPGAGDPNTVVRSLPGSAKYHRALRSVVVRCAQGTVLRVPMLKSEFRSLMSASSWWDGVQRHWKDSEGCIMFTNPPADHGS